MWLWSVPRIAHVNWAKVNPSAGTMDPQIECRGGRQPNKEPTEEFLQQSTWWFREQADLVPLLGCHSMQEEEEELQRNAGVDDLIQSSNANWIAVRGQLKATQDNTGCPT